MRVNSQHETFPVRIVCFLFPINEYRSVSEDGTTTPLVSFLVSMSITLHIESNKGYKVGLVIELCEPKDRGKLLARPLE